MDPPLSQQGGDMTQRAGNETRRAQTLAREQEILRLIKLGVGRAEMCEIFGYKKRSGLDQRITLLRAQGDLDGITVKP
jgi:hypothetical protein